MRGGSGGIFVCLAHAKVTNIDEQPLFTERSYRTVSKFIELWRSALRSVNISLEIYGRNLVKFGPYFQFFYLKHSKTSWNGRFLLVLTKLVDFVSKNAKIWVMLIKTVIFLLFFTKTWFFQNHAGTDFFFINEAKEAEIWSNVTSMWYLKICGTDFRIFDFFWKYGRFVQNFGHFANFGTYFKKRIKNLFHKFLDTI